MSSKRKPHSYPWLLGHGLPGMPRRIDYAAIGRKLLIVDELPTGARVAFGLELPKWCVEILEEF